MKKLISIILCAILTVCTFSLNVSAAETNSQPQTGPNGTDYLYDAVSERYSTDVLDYSTVFYPNNIDKSFPLLVFCHGYWINDATGWYLDLLNHICRKGYIILSLNYQIATTDPNTYPENAARQIIDGITYIENNSDKIPQITKNSNREIMSGFFGHSAGGVTSFNLAACYKELGIPKPYFVCALEGCDGGNGLVPTRDLSTIEADTNVLLVVAQEDTDETYITSENIWNSLSHIPKENKQWIEVISSKNGSQKLVADHAFPGASDKNSTNALDWHGTFKWCTALANYSFYSTDKEYWHGSTQEQTYMGLWADGTEITRIKASDTDTIRTEFIKEPTLIEKLISFFKTIIEFIKSIFNF